MATTIGYIETLDYGETLFTLLLVFFIIFLGVGSMFLWWQFLDAGGSSFQWSKTGIIYASLLVSLIFTGVVYFVGLVGFTYVNTPVYSFKRSE